MSDKNKKETKEAPDFSLPFSEELVKWEHPSAYGMSYQEIKERTIEILQELLTQVKAASYVFNSSFTVSFGFDETPGPFETEKIPNGKDTIDLCIFLQRK